MARVSARFAGLCLYLALSAAAYAHTSALSTSPKNGAVLEHSPPSIEITFKDAVRLTSVVVEQDGKVPRKLDSSPQASATTFKIDQPKLEPGTSHVRWTALSHDGHVIKGVIELTIKPATSPQ